VVLVAKPSKSIYIITGKFLNSEKKIRNNSNLHPGFHLKIKRDENL